MTNYTTLRIFPESREWLRDAFPRAGSDAKRFVMFIESYDDLLQKKVEDVVQ